MRLLSADKFDDIFAPLADKHVAVTDGLGNVGDRLIDAATRQLLAEFGVSWNTVNPFCDPINADYVLLAGGGSMGSWRAATHREAARKSGVPCILLPQSFMDADDTPFHKVYVREKASLEWRPDAVLAPDLALGFDFPEPADPLYDCGLFLRCDGHSNFPAMAKVDPCGTCHTVGQYIAVAEKYAHVVTDRLHLAIISLGLGRKTTLLPVIYHKNRAMWELWLKDMGCRWATRPEKWL